MRYRDLEFDFDSFRFSVKVFQRLADRIGIVGGKMITLIIAYQIIKSVTEDLGPVWSRVGHTIAFLTLLGVHL